MSNNDGAAFLSAEKTQQQQSYVDQKFVPPVGGMRRFADGLVKVGAAVMIMFVIVGTLLFICFATEPIYESEPQTLRPGDTIYFYDDTHTRRYNLVDTKQLICSSGCDYPRHGAPSSAEPKHTSRKLMPAFNQGFCVYQGVELTRVSHSAWRCSLPTYAAPGFQVESYRVQCEYTNASEQPDLMPAIIEGSCALYYSVTPIVA